MGTGNRQTDRENPVSSFEQFVDLAQAMGVRGLRVTEVRAAGTADSPLAHMFFRHADFPETLFAYRSLPAGVDRHEPVWLAEELATGALHRIMRSEPPAADKEGVRWLRLRGQLLAADPSTPPAARG